MIEEDTVTMLAYELYAQACLDADVARKKTDRLWDEYRRLLAMMPKPDGHTTEDAE